jgi:hypothetical protein
MREIELQFDSSNVVKAQADAVPIASASVQLIAPNGDIVQTVTATASSVATVTATGTTANSLVLDDMTGIAVGDTLRVQSAGNSYSCVVSAITDVAITLLTGLPAAPVDGSAVYGDSCSATFDPIDSSLIGSAYRLVWTFVVGETSTRISQTASVVRWRWDPVVTARDVRDILSELNQTRSEQWCQGVADRVDEVIQGKLLSTGKRPWFFLSSMAFYDAARTGIRYELSQRGVAFGQQIYEAQRELRFAFDDKLAQVVQGLQGILDANNNGIIEPAEQRPSFRTVQVYR